MKSLSYSFSKQGDPVEIRNCIFKGDLAKVAA